MSIQNIDPFLTSSLAILLLCPKIYLHIPDTKIFTRYMTTKYFLPYYGLSFWFLAGMLWGTNIFNFSENYFFLSYLLVLLLSYLRYDCLIQGHRHLEFCLRVFLLHLGLWFCFELSLNMMGYKVQWHYFAHRYVIVLAPFVENIIFPLNFLCILSQINWS